MNMDIDNAKHKDSNYQTKLIIIQSVFRSYLEQK